MMEKNLSISQRETFTPGGFSEFLWWLSTAEKEIISDCVVDRNRYRIIGMTVLATWAFATMSWTYFFSTIVHSAIYFIPLGLFMGFVILFIDRALIKGIHKNNRSRLTPVLFRGILALTIGTFMAQPAILYIFDKEIRLQASIDNEKRKITKRQELDSLYKDRKTELNNRIAGFEKERSDKYAEVEKARNAYIREADGTGGTGRVGIREIALAKRAEYEKLDQEYNDLIKRTDPGLADANKEILDIDESIKKEESLFLGLLNDGFLTRIEALSNLIKSNQALQTRYYLIVAILILIELMPVIAKSLLPSGAYDEKVQMREELEKEMAYENIRREKSLKEEYNRLAEENDREAIAAFFTLTKPDRSEKMKHFSARWKDDSRQTFDGMWEKIKREILTKQEN